MECFYGISNENSNKISDEYIAVNNFRYFKNIDTDIHTRREQGRLDYQIIYIDKGYGEFVINNIRTKIQSGNVALLRPDEKHRYTFKADSSPDYYWIHFTGKGVEQLLKALNLSGNIFKTGDFFRFKKIMDKMSKESAINDFTTKTSLAAHIISLLSVTAQNFHTPDNSMHKVIMKMETDFTNKLTNEDYAKICAISEYHFIRKFKNTTGLTPLQYKTKLIVNRAIDLMTTTELNISEIAHILGFDDNPYFSHVFKKQMGISPKKYTLQRHNNI